MVKAFNMADWFGQGGKALVVSGLAPPTTEACLTQKLAHLRS